MALSNKTLIYLISLAILITLFGTTISLTKLQEIQSLTGLATSQTGAVNVTVDSTASINLTVFELDWGAGEVGVGFTEAFLDTKDGSVTGGSWTPVTSGFQLQNIGNRLLNVTINGTNASSFMGGTTPEFRFQVINSTGNDSSCPGNLNSGQNDIINQTKIFLCDKFNFTAANSFLTIDINLSIPENAPVGSKNTSIIFDACDITDAGCQP